MKKSKHLKSLIYAIPFFTALGVMTVVSFLLPLRPEVSYLEKRELKKFPEFSVEALVSGEYFNDITLWFSDTFPGREDWLAFSQQIASLHGYGDISIQGARPVQMNSPTLPEPELPDVQPIPATETPSEIDAPTEATETAPEGTEPTVPETTAPAAPPATEETKSPEAEAQESILLDLTVNTSSVVQMGDTVFYPVGFSAGDSNRYIRSLNNLADMISPRGGRVINAVPPTAVGVLVPESVLSSIQSYPQSQILDYLAAGFSNKVIAVDTVRPLQARKDEYLYFHTDHHWTATAAYYAYCAVCEKLGMEPASLDHFTEMDQGTFMGSIYGKASNPRKLARDYVLTYDPIGDIQMYLVASNGYESPAPIIRDMREENENVKYIAFLHGDEPMVHIVNNDLPEGTSCLIVKDSFGNCFVPYFSMNYHDVYAIDFRKAGINIPYTVNQYNIKDVIMAPNMMSVQAPDGTKKLMWLCGLYE